MKENNCINLNNVSKSVNVGGSPLTIVREITLNVKPHEALVLTGESGSGKTSLLSIMAGLDTIDSGDIQLLGTDISQADEDTRAQVRKGQVGFVFQNFQLVSGATSLENVQLPLELLNIEHAKELALTHLEQVGLATKADTQVDYLSGGEQQRVALARAFSIKPTILFADEPTGNLDRKNGEQITDLMFKMRDDLGTALVLVTHAAGLAERGDRVLKMDAGRIIN